MKKSTLLLATLVLTPALYAQASGPLFTREQVLDVFARFNPAVLENASQDKEYEAVLDFFVNNYRKEISPANEAELIAVARNFDTSIRLDVLTKVYQEKWRLLKMTGQPTESLHRMFAHDLEDEIAHIWAVTVQLQQYRLDQAKAELARLRKDSPLSQRAQREQQLRGEIKASRAAIKQLQKQAGAYITSAVEEYIAQTDKKLEQDMFSVQRTAVGQATQQARATTNLQIKSKHKKPVAE